ncbi:MAG: hypothetical protein A3J46_03110 [Candidatus Yanofskybacteria bacterium RIFCSPHIGHO2_02_FULL_41_11]|uniref:DUF5671 domain-containing protein n=1 Tax=Candidatus Yanofskybacteria bacterium RIFCSPHIGHO2_02_FULL_41_11 TaxID=1802675 RepID=A0A1F8F9E1_9BACT|nr:MAG: hypothetical protein A3J46_03110 [Candidatus Yanofskybacteria bacterium RIFCSPHIGHO2_02_FULL_41_11]
MINQDLLNYIQQTRKQGQTDAQIQQTLLQQGWNISDISQALTSTVLPPPAVYNGQPLVRKSSALTVAVVTLVIIVILLIVGGAIRNYKIKKSIEKLFGQTSNQNLPSDY